MNIKEYINKNKPVLLHSSYLLFLNVAIISLLLIILNTFNIIDIALILSLNWLFSIFIFSLLISLVSKYNLNSLNSKSSAFIETIFQISPYFFLSLLIVLAINQFLKLDFINSLNFRLVILGIAFGFLSFYKNRDKVEQDLEDEKAKEEQEEARRKSDFAFNFPRINKIWGLRSVVKWMYKEGWWYSGGLIAIVLIGLALRMWNISNLGIWVEEQFAVIGARDILSGMAPHIYGSLYTRSILYALLNAGSMGLFGLNDFSIKLIPAIFGIILVPLSYALLKLFLCRRYAMIGALIIATSDFLLLYSRFNRFYIALGFLLLLNIYFLYKGFYADNKCYRYLSFILIFLIPGFDSNSIVILVSTVVCFIILDKEIFKKLQFLFYIISGIIGFLVFRAIEKLSQTNIDSSAEIVKNYYSSIFPIKFNGFFFSFLSVYFPDLLVSAILIFLFVLLSKTEDNKTHRRNLIFLSSCYSIILLLLLSFYKINTSNFNWDQRHISFLFPIIIINFIIFLAFLNKIFKKGRILFLFTIGIVLATSLINPVEINKVINMGYGDRLESSPHFIMSAEPYRSDYKTPYLYVNNHYEEGDTIIADDFLNIYLIKEIDYQLSEDDNATRLKDIVDIGARVWLIDVTYDMQKYHTKYRWGNIYKFLENNKGKIVYFGLDNKTRVFLFNNDSI